MQAPSGSFLDCESKGLSQAIVMYCCSIDILAVALDQCFEFTPFVTIIMRCVKVIQTYLCSTIHCDYAIHYPVDLTVPFPSSSSAITFRGWKLCLASNVCQKRRLSSNSFTLPTLQFDCLSILRKSSGSSSLAETGCHWGVRLAGDLKQLLNYL